jgi:hypothetical protein
MKSYCNDVDCGTGRNNSSLPICCRLGPRLQTENQIYATSTEQIHSLHLPHAHEAGLPHFSMRVEISHTASPQVG